MPTPPHHRMRMLASTPADAGVRVRMLVLAAGLTLLPLSGYAQQPAPQPTQQETQPGQPRALTLLLQPGMLSADFLSPPEGYESTTGFNLRFATVVPTRSRWVTLLVGGSVTPYGTSGISFRNNNTPTLFAGNVFPGFTADRTNGWVSLELPLLLTYAFGGGGSRNQDLFGKDIVVEAAFSVHLGRKVLRELGPPLSRLQLYFLIDHVLTPNEDPVTGRVDRFNPVAMYGITIPIGGRRESRLP